MRTFPVRLSGREVCSPEEGEGGVGRGRGDEEGGDGEARGGGVREDFASEAGWRMSGMRVFGVGVGVGANVLPFDPLLDGLEALRLRCDEGRHALEGVDGGPCACIFSVLG